MQSESGLAAPSTASEAPPTTGWLALHTDRARERFLRADAPPRYDEAARCWIVVRPDDVIAMLRSPRLRSMPSMEHTIGAVEKRYGIELPHLRFIVDHMPLLNEGEKHQNMRRTMAPYLAGRRAALQERLPQLVEKHLDPLRSCANIELMGDVLSPLVTELFWLLIEIEDGDCHFDRLSVTRIFDRFVSVSWLKRIDEALGRIRQAICARHPADREAMLLDLIVLGRDSLLSSLGVSLARVLLCQVRRPLTKSDFPAMLPETGVAIAERFAVADFDLGEVKIRRGDWVRLYLQSFSYAKDSARQALVFGVGVHSCLGRQISLDVWTEIAKWLASLPRRLEVLPFQYCETTVFAMPERLEAKLR
jgi:cytochrome P450